MIDPFRACCNHRGPASATWRGNKSSQVKSRSTGERCRTPAHAHAVMHCVRNLYPSHPAPPPPHADTVPATSTHADMAMQTGTVAPTPPIRGSSQRSHSGTARAHRRRRRGGRGLRRVLDARRTRAVDCAVGAQLAGHAVENPRRMRGARAASHLRLAVRRAVGVPPHSRRHRTAAQRLGPSWSQSTLET